MLIVFDLYYTLWNTVENWRTNTYPPFKLEGEIVYDAQRGKTYLYKESREALEHLQQQNIAMAIASRPGEPAWAHEIMEMLDIRRFFSHEEIYPGDKRKHFEALHQKTGIAFKDMIFFDDEMENIENISKLGVKCIFVPEGMTMKLLLNNL